MPAENIAAVLSGAMAMLAMVLTTVDAVCRYAFDAPLTFQFHFTSHYLLVGLLLMAMPWGFRTGGYIRIGLVTEKIAEGPRMVLFRIGLLVSAYYLSVLCWKSFEYFWDAYTQNKVEIEEINWPVAWSWVWLPVGLALLACRVFLTATGPAAALDMSTEDELLAELER